MLTKSEEKELFESILRSIPEGYVKSILESIQTDVNWAISADFGFVDLKQRIKETEEHRARMSTEQNKINALRKQIDEMEGTFRRLSEGVAEVRSIVRKLNQI